MLINEMEQGFQSLYESTKLLQKALDCSFLEAFVENGENILDHFQVQIVNDTPSLDEVVKIETFYQKLEKINFSPEDKRKLAQLVLLKCSMEDHLQPNYQLTPDSIGYLFGYMVESLANKKDKISLFDGTVGMGNLILTVILQLKSGKINVDSYGIDVDDLLISIASVVSQWAHVPLKLYHQDSLQRSLLVPKVDFAISDLPVGYYPNDRIAEDYQTSVTTGHSYAHHLLLEQSMRYVKDEGFGLFLVPSNLFETEQAESLKKWMFDSVYLQAMIQLPENLFKSKNSRKSFLLLQNKGEKSKQVDEVLLAELSSLKDQKSVQQFFQQFEAWKTKNIN